MASSFQKYSQGIQPVTGMAEAGSNIGKMYQQGLGAIGVGLAEGIKAYNENSAKSEMANAKIQTLGQDIANKIAMYSKDPEIAQSGILEGLMAKAQALQEAPAKSLSQRIAIAHDAETSLAGFGNQLQEWSFLRGREMERAAQEGLQKFSGVKTVTDPTFTKAGEFAFDPNKTLEQNKADALAKLNTIRRSNPKMEGTDEDFLATWLANSEQAIAKADPNVIPAAVSSSVLEQIAASKRILQSNKEAQKTGLVEDFLARGKKSSKADFEKVNTSVADVLGENQKKAETFAPDWLLQKAKEEKQNKAISSAYLQQQAPLIVKNLTNKILEQAEQGNQITPRDIMDFLGSEEINNNVLANTTPNLSFPVMASSSQAASYARWGHTNIEEPTFTPAASFVMKEIKKLEKTNNLPLTSEDILRLTTSLGGKVDEFQKIAQNVVEKAQSAPVQEKPKAPVVPLGEMPVGSVTKEQRLSVMERQKEVADFITSRMGAIDPTDPERKRRLPVAGFDKFYKSLVPESEIREFTTDSGIRMMYANGKWEQIKGSEQMSLQDIRKSKVGVYGQQDASGRFVPTEFVEGSGVYIGGLYSGSDAGNEKYSEEIANLIDARRGVKVLQQINDQMGESLSPTAQGKALVEEMNLAAMLRTDIVGVGTVSNYEQELIKKVTERSTNFFSLESKDRAVLIALAQRVDRRIKNISAAKGLTVVIKDDTGGNKYQALREQYLKEKGLL
jgi:hypothetical protein